MEYLRGVEEHLKISRWDFSPLLPTIEERLEPENQQKLHLVISLLKGEVELKEAEKKLDSISID